MKTGVFKLFLLLLVITLSLTACIDEAEQPVIENTSAAAKTDAVPFAQQIEKINYDPLQLDSFPSLYISGIAADKVQHREWARGISVSLRGAGEELDFEKARARIRGRGNATWWAMGDKRPYVLRFESPRSMFGSEYIARDWIILANSIDYSLMRNLAAFSLGERLARFDFTPMSSQFIHVYIDGDYRGVYQFTDLPRQNQGRIEVNYNPDPALSEYHIEWCRHGRRPGQVPFYADDVPFRLHYPEYNDVTDEHVAFISDFINKAGQAIRDGNLNEIAAFIDIATFIDFYLVNEFTKNADVFFSSVHLTVRLEENGKHKIYAGPLWDFDQSAGGTFDGFYPDYSPQGAWAATEHDWFRRLFRIPEFVDLVLKRWLEIRNAEIADTLAEIRYITTAYKKDFDRNFERWTEKLGQYLWRTPPHMQAIGTYEGQVDYLLDWFEQRIVWMDEFLISP